MMYLVMIESDAHAEVMARCTNRRAAESVASTVHGGRRVAYVVPMDGAK